MGFQGSLKELPLPDVIQLVATSGKTGAFLIRDERSEGKIYLKRGTIVHAEAGSLSGEEAIYALATWSDGEFQFEPGERAQTETISKSNTELLIESARRIDEWRVLAKKIPSTRMIPTFVELDREGGVSFTPQEWRVVQKIDERRDIDELAAILAESSLETAKVLYSLITSGIVTLNKPGA